MKILFLIILVFAVTPVAQAKLNVSDFDSVSPVNIIQAGDIESMRAVLDLAENLPDTLHRIRVVNSDSGGTVTAGGLRNLDMGNVLIQGDCSPRRCSFEPDPTLIDLEQFVILRGPAVLGIERVEIVQFTDGAISATDTSELYVSDCSFEGNMTPGSGAAISTTGEAYVDSSYNVYKDNISALWGDHLQVNANPGKFPVAFLSQGDQFYSTGGSTGWENPFGHIEAHGITFVDESGANATGGVWMFNSVFESQTSDGPNQVSQALISGGDTPSKTESLCNDFGSGAFVSQGFNIASDSSCDLDQSTDLPGTDPMIALNEDGLLMPLPGSPAIDSGTWGLILINGSPLASLPCGYRDFAGTARPQDANGDGVFECDRGAMEVMGEGEIVPGHSSVFYNPERNGEGNYVEILENGQAIVYTFSYNPEGTGPAWFLGVGEVNGNSIVLDDLLRPVGTPFGDDFDSSEIDFTSAGSMSMVFPDCQASAPGGNIAFTGDVTLGYEALITRSTRLAHIAGCGAETPVTNAGLSGSFYDAARNGEGLIIEWLTNGDVLVVFFTYDPDGNQMWLFGQGPSSGKSVTLTALYPTSFTPWGRGYVAEDVALNSWGTFTLTWTDCNTMTFEYNSTVPGYGAGTRNYTRLSTLSGVNCPAFP